MSDVKDNLMSEYYVIQTYNAKWIKKSQGYLFSKRLFDIVFAGLSIVFILPVLIIITFLVKMSSSGPVLYGHSRVGQYGKPIIMYKFRTTHSQNETEIPQFTPIGRLLWRTSLQELPVYYNILKGNMSFVGPRPLLPREVNSLDLESLTTILSVKPGITGLACISNDYDEAVALDADYVRNASFILDIKILLKTIQIVIFARRKD